MKIYINNVLVDSEILPVNTPTLDETLETFSFALVSNTNATPYAPMQDVRVEFEDDNNEIIYLVLVSDSVDVFSLNPLKYKHSITCTENIRKLSKQLVRNSVFSQPAYKYKKSFNAISGVAMLEQGSDTSLIYTNQYLELNARSEKLVLAYPEPLSKERIKKSYFKMSLQFMYGDYYGVSAQGINYKAKTTSDIIALATDMTSISTSSYLILRYEKDGITSTENITPSTFGWTEWNFNTEVIFPRLQELVEQGYNNFEVLFPSLDFIYGTCEDNLHNNLLSLYMVQIELIAETYYHTCYDVLQLLIERQSEVKQDVLFSLPDSGDLYDLLTLTPAPNFTFTQCTLFECVAEVFRVFDAIFTLDANNVLGITYFNDINKSALDNPKFSNQNSSLSEDKYTNGLVSYYQDGRVVENFPSNKSFAGLRSSEMGVPTAGDHNFILPHSIYSIIKVEILTQLNISLTGSQSMFTYDSMPIDITRFVVEESIWTVLNSSPMGASDYSSYVVKQANSVYYAKNDNKIQVGYSVKDKWGVLHYALHDAVLTSLLRNMGVKSTSQGNPYEHQYVDSFSDWKSVKMRATYESTIDGRLKIESINNKYKGETLVDQSNGAVDLNKLGLNILGLSMKLGEPTLNMTQKLCKWEERIKVGDIYSYNNEIWIANVCSYTVFGDYIQGKISFVKNFNELALRTRLLKEKRFSNISSELTQKSEDNYIDYIYFTSKDTNTFVGDDISFNGSYLAKGLFLSFYDDDIDFDISYSALENLENLNVFYLPLSKYGAGNSICFEMSYESPISAGNKTTYETSTTWFGTNKYYTSAVKYTDDDGFLILSIVALLMSDESTNFDENFPNITGQLTNSTILMRLHYSPYKQPNEIFALNYQLAFLPKNINSDFVGSAFINSNAFIERNDKKLYLYYSTSEIYSVLDIKGIGTKLAISSCTYSYDSTNHKTTIEFNHDSVIANVKSWSVCDENDNILFAFNETSTPSGMSIGKSTIYFITKSTRL